MAFVIRKDTGKKLGRRLTGIFQSIAAVFAVTIAVLPFSAQAQSGTGDIVGKVTVGYQGWFSAGEGTPPDGLAWEHWSTNNKLPAPASANIAIKAWPDMRPYQTLYGSTPMQYQSGFGTLGNGLPATLFSSYNRDVVDIHMKWLGEYGKPTVAIQRFNPTGATAATINAGNVLATAPKYGVKFYIDYDITGWTNYATEIPNDWTNVINGQLQMTASPFYAKQNGKPVVQLWIATSTSSTTPKQMLSLITWLKNQGLYVILGTSRGWRTDDPAWLPVYNAANMIQPWMIGSIGNISDSDAVKPLWQDDLAYANAHGFDFQAAVLPGDNAGSPPQRVHGDFMWEQFANAVSTGVKSVYVSMYDEYNEGNQIMPTAEDASMSTGGLPTLDIDGTHCSADYYMRLTDDGQKMLQGQLALTYTRPTQPVVQVQKLIPGTTVSFQAMANGNDVTADNAGASPLIANRTTVGPWELYMVVDAGNTNIALKSLSNNLYVTTGSNGSSPLSASTASIGLRETFTEVPEADGNIALRETASGAYVTAESAGTAPLVANRTSVGPWETFIVTAH
ncbi:hypothetical protein [Burkholderia sp. PAMC 26561]|uniref:hypothetical protein n=1 Tax=Burkholderia sp. PAMC 26561 TaxID=1795043 RepID=UPI00076B24E2|nr:hypothetical protein [Burkholderia sp. PAMC 26561]AME26987.1 hypothetical protein AXG89_23800 [Burkholderia sp. PAMC 26561]AME27868.1 hypothetical protein AXG89_28890 [Burkholderia sp. PAMC 26561]